MGLVYRRTTHGWLFLFRACSAVAAASSLVAGCTSQPRPTPSDDLIRVVRVVDGQTFEANAGRGVNVVGLIGVDVEFRRPGDTTIPMCLGSQARQKLATLLPAGSQVQLISPGANAAVRQPATGLLVNAAMVQSGFAIPRDSVASPATKSEIAAAQKIAQRNKVGYYSDKYPCTVPGKVAAFAACTHLESVVPAETSAPSSTASSTSSTPLTTSQVGPTRTNIYDGTPDGIQAMIESAHTLSYQLTHPPDELTWKALDSVELEHLHAILAQHIRRCDATRTDILSARESSFSSASSAADQRESKAEESQSRSSQASERRVAASVAAEQKAQESAERSVEQAAEAARQAEVEESRQAQEAETSEAEQQPSNPVGGESSSIDANDPSTDSDSSGGSDGYTGKRCYAPGGKTYREC